VRQSLKTQQIQPFNQTNRSSAETEKPVWFQPEQNPKEISELLYGLKFASLSGFHSG